MTTQGATPKINPTVAKYGGMPSLPPWEINRQREDAWEIVCPLDTCSLSICEVTYTGGNAEANARLIVEAVNSYDRLARMATAGEALARGVAWWLDATPARSSVQERKDALRAVRQAIANFEEASRE